MRVASRSLATTHDIQHYFRAVLQPDKYQQFCRRHLFNDAQQLVVRLDMHQAKLQLNEMHSKITLAGVRTLVWWFTKTMRHSLQGLVVDTDSVRALK